MEVEMKIKGLMIDPITQMPIIILRDLKSNAVLPIWVGIFEANAIALQIEKIATPRPMTHDLLRNIIHQPKGEVKRIVICDLKENTFYAIYFALTGLHGLHVIGGIVVIGYLVGPGAKLWQSDAEYFTNRVECTGLYWHFVDLVWIFLFPVFYLL